MSLYKRGAVYWCEWEIGGKRIRETTGTPDRQAAQEYHDRRRADLWRQIKLGEVQAQTWDEAAISWVNDHAQHKKSFETDRTRLVWLTKKLTGQPLPAITTDALLILRKALLTDKAPATANRFLAVVSAVLHYAHDRALISGVPKIPYLAEPKDRFRWLTRPQAVALIAELPEHLAAMTRFALATGLRRANVTGMTWKSLDTDRCVAWVWPDEAKAGKPISVPLNDDALAVLAERHGIDSRYVFTYKKNPIYNTTTKAWEKACARAGIDPGLTFHDLRHTWASWHVMGGTPLEVLRQLGGWADMTMVLRYAHLAPGYVAGYAGNASITIAPPQSLQISPTAETQAKSADEEKAPETVGIRGFQVGRHTGIEPVTPGITIQCSTD